MAETKYNKDKVYLPREVKEKLGLVNGDKVQTGVTVEEPDFYDKIGKIICEKYKNNFAKLHSRVFP